MVANWRTQSNQRRRKSHHNSLRQLRVCLFVCLFGNVNGKHCIQERAQVRNPMAWVLYLVQHIAAVFPCTFLSLSFSHLQFLVYSAWNVWDHNGLWFLIFFFKCWYGAPPFLKNFQKCPNALPNDEIQQVTFWCLFLSNPSLVLKLSKS